MQMQTILKVEGMTCSHCEKAVVKAVSALDGITEAAVNLAEKTVIITHDESVRAEVVKNAAKAIEEQGYDVAGGD